MKHGNSCDSMAFVLWTKERPKFGHCFKNLRRLTQKTFLESFSSFCDEILTEEFAQIASDR
jgi:hypothetical protein